MKLISNKPLREFAERHGDAQTPLQVFRRCIERGRFDNFAQLKAAFPAVDKVGERYVFNIGGNKYRLVAWLHFETQRCFIKAVLTHHDYDQGNWK